MLAQLAQSLLLECTQDPETDLLVNPGLAVVIAANDSVTDGAVGLVLLGLVRFGLVLVFFGYGVDVAEWREPSVLQEHGIGRTQLGNLVEGAGDKVAGGFGELVGGKIWRRSVDNGLLKSVFQNMQARCENSGFQGWQRK